MSVLRGSADSCCCWIDDVGEHIIFVGLGKDRGRGRDKGIKIDVV
jgi:hypothetical protein